MRERDDGRLSHRGTQHRRRIALSGGAAALRRLPHGRGTGALRQAVRSYVREHPQVLGYRSGSISEGGIGVTVVKLK